MKAIKQCLIVTLISTAFLPSAAHAQKEKPGNSWIQLSVQPPRNEYRELANIGVGVGAGAEYRVENSRFAWRIEGSYIRNRIRPSYVRENAFPNQDPDSFDFRGHLSTYTVSLGATFDLPSEGAKAWYAIATIGASAVRASTRTALNDGIPLLTDFAEDIRTNLSGGIGVRFPTRSHQLFLEGRYQTILFDNAMSSIPISFGIRF